MRVTWVAMIAVGIGCYQAPSADPACAMLCTDTCPGDLTCVNGTCVGDGQTCTPVFEHVSAGNGFACALDSRDLLWCWGSNANHQLSADEVQALPFATRIGNARWDAISAGRHVCGLRDGALSCWGANDRGQVSAAVLGDVREPLAISAPDGGAWSMVSAGFDETCGIADGRLYCWGANDRGQLGVGDIADRGVPTPVLGDVIDWIEVSSGPDHTCAISATAGLHCWGYNDHGQLGDGAIPSTVPVPVPVAIALPGATAVAVAKSSTCALANTELYCWGQASSGALGDPSTILTTSGDHSTPTIGSGLTGWTSIDAAEELGCATRGDEVWCWGRTRGGGGLGNGVWASGGNSTATGYFGQVVSGASELSLGWNANFDDVDDTGAALADSANLDLGCVVMEGEIHCWGDNRFGQLGQGTATMQPTPQLIAGDHRWTTLATGSSHTCGLSDGNLYCWGSMSNGQVDGIVSGTPAVPCGSAPGLDCDVLAPKQVMFHATAQGIGLGQRHTCAIEGTVITCWGDNTYNQTSASPVSPFANQVVAGAWTKIYTIGASGTIAQCAVDTAGLSHCWGGFMGNWTPTITHVPSFDTMSSIGISATGMNFLAFGCVLDQNQQLACFGDNRFGQYGNGPPGTGALCGNAACDDGETSTSCPADCGAYPMSNLGRAYHEISVAGTQMQGGYGCGIRIDRELECWGRNSRGATAYADPSTGVPPPFIYAPYKVPGLSSCTAVATATSNACAICGGELYCWGDHRRGAVGSGPLTTSPVTVPRKLVAALPADEVWAQVVLGSGYGCARTDRGTGYCWGLSTRGALGTGAASANLPITVKLAP